MVDTSASRTWIHRALTKDAEASERIFARAVHDVLSILVDAPELGFGSYHGRSSRSPSSHLRIMRVDADNFLQVLIMPHVHARRGCMEDGGKAQA